MAKNALARRKSTKAEKKAASATRRAAKYREEARGMGPALWRGFTFLAGAAGSGAVSAKMPEIMGIPSGGAGALLLGGAAIATRSTSTLNFAFGWLAPLVAEQAYDAVSSAAYKAEQAAQAA